MLFDPNWTPPKVIGVAPVRGVAPVTDKPELEKKKDIVVLDLRDTASYAESHIPNSFRLPLDGPNDKNPYKDTQTMVRQFRILDERLGANDPEFGEALKDKIVLTLSHRGHMGRLAMSVLRERDVQAHCVMEGYEGWKKAGLWGKWA